MKLKYFNISLLVLINLLITGCLDIKDRKTTVEIEDNYRHYFPILAGELKDLVFNIKNTGDEPLILTDIITSCGCLKNSEGIGGFSIPPKKERKLILSYNSAKNIGAVKHFVTLYGNFKDAEYKEIVFDINVVPGALYTKDYEELYTEELEENHSVELMMDGRQNGKGYYMPEPPPENRETK
ncbi:DUF1573 domain-containing protein [Sphingobacterium sp. BS-2]|uniref:DUF1573 domain-containing protein n=1 Tax=Sphingobacterium sp. BS-2 TaxID=3377129 RepID=UPI0038FCE805